MNKIAQNSALDIVSEAMEKTGYIGSPIGVEVNLHSRDHRDHLNFLMTVADMGINEGLKRDRDDCEQDDLLKLMQMATRTHHVRNSGTSVRLATAYALYAMMNPGQAVKTEDTHKKDMAHSAIAEVSCLILSTLNIPFRRIDNRSFVVTTE